MENHMKNFRTYQLSIQFNRATSKAIVSGHLRNQLLRAASSVTLNLGEGYGRVQSGDQRRFFKIALGSLRECQACFALSEGILSELEDLADHLAASLWKLILNK
jgi:four helix bundle protein